MTSRELAEGLLAMTEAIQNAAQQADWPEAAHLTQARSPLLMSLTADMDDETRNIVQRIQAVDQSVVTMAATGKDTLHAEYREAMRCASATKEYDRVAML